jgi:hypothetical protein
MPSRLASEEPGEQRNEAVLELRDIDRHAPPHGPSAPQNPVHRPLSSA